MLVNCYDKMCANSSLILLCKYFGANNYFINTK